MQESSAFIDDLLELLSATTRLSRARWEKKHSELDYFADSWQYAMYAPWRSFNPLEILPILRSYIDEWIDTGFHPDGSERPYKRNFTPRQRKDGESLGDYHKSAPIEATPAVQAIARLHSAELVVPMEKPVYQIQNACQVIRFLPEGGIEYIKPSLSQPDAEKCAARIFLDFYSSEWRYRLMRCQRCRSLRVPKRNPRKYYERGWHCDQCRHGAAAQAATSKSRALIRDRWFRRAVDAYQKFEKLNGQTKRDKVRYITEHVNAGLPPTQKIKRNMITRNLAEIQAAAEGSSHATRKD
jgi:hypothetical protein